jgi:CO dehydrogenase/acetyl-CoA synthase beta subunit
MELFESAIGDIRAYQKKRRGIAFVHKTGDIFWPKSEGRNVVLAEDTAVELGNPQQESVSCLIWTQQTQSVSDGRMTLVGPDIGDSKGQSLPFGKVVLACVSGFNEENAYDRYKEMEAVRYSLDLKGYMIRAVSQYQREWSRISKDAVRDGFSFEMMAASLRREYLKKDYVHAVEFLFVTSSREDVRELRNITQNVGRTINALDKMLKEIDPDCDECEYNDVCNDVGELRGMRRSRKEKNSNAQG